MSTTVLSTHDLEQLLSVVQELSQKRELEQITAVVRTHARRLVGSDGISFVLREGDRVFYADEDAIAPLWKGQRFPIEACISGQCILHGKSIGILDIYEDPRVPHGAYAPTFVKSLAMVPIRRDEPIGAIGAYWAASHEATEREMALLQAVADAAAIAIDNERLRRSDRESRMRAEAIAQQQQWLLETVSHDLRAPLSAVIMCSALIVKDANGDPRNQKFRRQAEVIQRNADRMERLIRSMLDLATIEGNGLQLRLQRVRTAEILEELRELEPLAVEKRQLLDILTDGPHAELDVLCDRDRIMQVLFNLVSNAIKFTPDGGTIRVLADRKPQLVEFVVEDDGPGIDAAMLPRLFDRFSRGDRTRSHDGVGLGLAIANGIVTAHETRLHVENRPERGARFRFTLPVVDCDA